jgi:polyhydroxyalkanoate synthesis regulator phasin
MSTNIHHRPFKKTVLRTPLFPVNFYKTLTSGRTISEKKLKETFDDALVREAVFLASPPLYEELVKWANGEITEKKKQEKLKYALLKYLSRMSARCTPFGLFAGCAVGSLGDKTELTLHKPEDHKKHTRLDMNYLVALSQNLAKDRAIKKQLLFFPNTGIYEAGNQLRYVEYGYINTQRHHHIVAVDNSVYLDKILQAAKQGKKLKDLASLLVDEENTEEEAQSFVDELVESQLLISELEPSVSGPEFLGQILQVLSKLKKVSPIVKTLKEVESELLEIDLNMGNPVGRYYQISDKLKGLNTEFDLKFLFQTDMVLSPKAHVLSDTVVGSVKKAVSLFNKITLPPQETFLNQFREAFYDRFEEREVSLSKALDVEMGIGYKQNQGSAEVNPLVDDLVLPIKNATTQDVKRTSIDVLFQKKFFEAIIQKEYTIVLTDGDFKDFEENWDDLPDTMSTMIEVVMVDGRQKIKCSGIGGSSAGNLLGRFCHGDEQLNELVQEIVNIETEMNTDKILAEIVHLPESRVGNILMRPAFRKHEIPYLAKSVLDTDSQIPIEDLTLSVKNGNHIVLKSKKHGREVIPHLTNAHNYSANALPIYHFLCDMQAQGKRGYLGINLGAFIQEYDFIPRIEYHDLVLSEAIWNIKKLDIERLQKHADEEEKLIDLMNGFRKERTIPQFVMLTDGDNELLINLENLDSVRMLLDTVRKRESFKLTEFLFGEDGVVKSEDNQAYYANQIVLAFYNSEMSNNNLGYQPES